MSKFQIIILGLFAVLAVGGLVFFSVYKGNSNAAPTTITIWGYLDQTTVQNYLDALTKQAGIKTTVKYYQTSKSKLYQAYVEGLATNSGPDLLIISQDQYLQLANKLYLIPYQTLSQSTFNNSYIAGDQIFLQSQGVAAVPFAVDPMVMYWNKDIFRNALVASVPQYWSDVTALAPTLTTKDQSLTITTSAVGLGEYANIDHAKDILSLLIMQTGNPIDNYSSQGLVSYLASTNSSGNTAADALSFYTQFADPLKQSYAWNRALPDSETLFIQNHLAMYFGYASEFSQIKNKNPNLNFDVASIPQSKASLNGQPIKMTYGTFYGVALSRNAHDTASAIAVAELIGSQSGSQLWSQLSGMPSDRRDSLNFSSSNSVTATFATAAFLSNAWRDPNPSKTDPLFQTMIENVTSGRGSPNDAISQANFQLQSILQPTPQ